MLNKITNIKKPLLIAEISGNHCGKIQIAKKLIFTAKKFGADFVKLQTYTPATMTINSKRTEFKIKNGLWRGKTLWNLYKDAQTPFSWHKELFAYSKKIGITCFSTPFDETAVDLLEKLKCPFYKVSSYELTDIPLIKRIAKTKKPMIISTGMASLKEIEFTYKIAKKNGCPKIILLYCVSNYPSDIKDFNLNNINILKKKFKCEVGLSDHSNNFVISELATALGVKIIEKHIALDNQKKGTDVAFSLKGKQIREFKKRILLINNLLGKETFHRTIKELKNKAHRRSIYSISKISKGEKFSKKNIKVIRPSNGLEPKLFNKILGKKAKKNIKIHTPLIRGYF